MTGRTIARQAAASVGNRVSTTAMQVDRRVVGRTGGVIAVDEAGRSRSLGAGGTRRSSSGLFGILSLPDRRSKNDAISSMKSFPQVVLPNCPQDRPVREPRDPNIETIPAGFVAHRT
ncbi:MAG TPA: hypothetical protein VHL31_25530 [Geminicoccus sp.]|uniref:hypothetical protein n=1 Tax=Geminicoccus sp. TaxID=2024832 RepID=UPI002E36B84B|nr:hypothetical protein [Geminicoccus sp.]HEX2529638.1 hypothetical protein [Geminicoccus sp.]